MAPKPKPLKPTVAQPTPAKPTLAARKKSLAITVEKAATLEKVATAAQPIAKVPQPKPASPADIKTSMADALKKNDLIDKVVATTGAKKAMVRDIVEATLNVLGDALSKGAMLNLPPFGKVKVSRTSDAASGRPMTLKLRRSPADWQGRPKGGVAKSKQALADTDDER